MAGLLDFLMGGQQPQAQPPQDMVQGILSSRFLQPSMGDYSGAIMRSINGQPTQGADMAQNRMGQTMGLLSEIDKMNQVKLALGKFNIDQQSLMETIRHNRATEGSAANVQPITTAPTTPPGTGYNPPPGSPVQGANPMMPALVQQESGGNPNAVSSVGASGTYQIMPATAKNPGYGVTPLRWWDGNDPRTAPQMEQERFANDYLNALQVHNGGNPQLAAASYNAGPDAVDRAGGNIAQLPQETQNYVKQVAPQDQPLISGQPRMTPQGEGFNPLFRGNEIFKDNLPQNFAYVPNPAGGVMAKQIPGTIEKGSNGEVLSVDSAGNVTQQVPPNPQAKELLEKGLNELANKINRLHKVGGTIERGPDNLINNYSNTIAGSQFELPEWAGGGRFGPANISRAQGTEAQGIRDEIASTINRQLMPMIQAMGATPGMERAASAQQKVLESLASNPSMQRDSILNTIAGISAQLGTGKLAGTLGFGDNTKYSGPKINETSQSAAATPASPPNGAKQGVDGGWYLPDPNRPGKYLQWQP